MGGRWNEADPGTFKASVSRQSVVGHSQGWLDNAIVRAPKTTPTAQRETKSAIRRHRLKFLVSFT